jgi:deazaflavin-dependent oxidoreductase (nitroreductase family)
VNGADSTGPAPDDGDPARLEQLRAAATAEVSKHSGLLSSARRGQILSAMMLPFFLVRPPVGFGVLTTIGRKTGKPRRKCIRVIRRGDVAYLVQLRPPQAALTRPTAVAGWVWNIRANPNVRLRMRGETFSGVAREISDPNERDQARTAICETVNLFDYGECDLHLSGLPTREKIKNLHRYWFDTGIPLAIDLRG